MDITMFWISVYIAVLAAFTGYVVISRVPVILHTPLMSGSNFIHGIVLVGAMVALGLATTSLEKIIGFIAVVLGAANVTGAMSSPSGSSRCSTAARRSRKRRSRMVGSLLLSTRST